VLAHECAHMRRQDFAKNLLYEFLSVAVQYHPMLALTRAGLAETRELVCDEMALDALPGRENYARSLLRLASMLAGRTAPRLLHAIGILDANIFERRIMNLTRKMRTPGTARRLLAAAACGLIAVVTCISALALQTDVPAQSAKSGGPVEVKPGEMVNNLITKVAPVYPPEAKAAKVQGTVVLDATIGKDGHMENLRVESGPAMLQQSSMDAVRNWVYKPYLLNGEPVVVQTKINVIYTLDKHSGGKKATKN
jgi:TonB family protein